MNPYEIIHLKVNIETEFVIVGVLKGLVKHFHFLIYWYICCTHFTILPDILKYEKLCKNATQISGKMYRKEIPPKFLPHVECLVCNHLTQKNLRSCAGIFNLYLSSKWIKNINDIRSNKLGLSRRKCCDHLSVDRNGCNYPFICEMQHCSLCENAIVLMALLIKCFYWQNSFHFTFEIYSNTIHFEFNDRPRT